MKDSLAFEILETIPLVMHDLRKEVRRQRDPSVTVEEFRVMAFIEKNKGPDLSKVADNIGLSLPSVSKIVDALIRKKSVLGSESLDDRRRLILNLTEKGYQDLSDARHSAETYLTRKVSSLEESRQLEVAQALQVLRTVFSGVEKRKQLRS